MEEVPQLEETGLSGDYTNEFNSLIMAYSQATPPNKILNAIKLHRGLPIFKKYVTRFPHDEYRNVITQKNELKVRQLDEIVDGINEKWHKQTPTEEEFIGTMNRIYEIIRDRPVFEKCNGTYKIKRERFTERATGSYQNA